MPAGAQDIGARAFPSFGTNWCTPAWDGGDLVHKTSDSAVMHSPADQFMNYCICISPYFNVSYWKYSCDIFDLLAPVLGRSKSCPVEDLCRRHDF